MNDALHELAQRIAMRWAELPDVEAVAIAGSQATGVAGDQSDIDVYIYTHCDIVASVRAGVAREFSDAVEIVDYWGAGIEYDDARTGIHVDLVFFNVDWMEAQIERVLDLHQASLGYTTCFWHTARISLPLFDRSGWFARLQERAKIDYPEALAQAIIMLNHPVLRQITSSYLRQLAKAAARGDLVSLNHRTAAMLASYFDILYAINRLPHPGEKRLLDDAEARCFKRPATMRADIARFLSAGATPGDPVVSAANQLLDGLDDVLRREGLLPLT